MRKKLFLIIIMVNICLLSSVEGASALSAFPGAEGFGAEAIGGRGGQIVKVTNLNDSGPGSFRDAVEADSRHYYNSDTYHYEPEEDYLARLDLTGHRIIIFDVSGIINLESSLWISYPYLTIAGQTSPGGILVTGYQTTVNAHDIIIQHMRFRGGSHRIADGADPEQLDAFDIWGNGWGPVDSYNIIIDHCSFSWGVDETMTISGGVLNATVQWSIVSEGLSHAGHPKGEHSKGLLVSGKPDYLSTPSSVSLHHNYIAHNTDRVPQISSPEGEDTLVDVVNNVSYNWKGGLSPYSTGSAKVNWIHNYVKQGERSNTYSYEVAYANPLDPVPLIYVYGNMGSTRLNQTDSQWNVGVDWHNELLSEDYRRSITWETPVINTTEMSYEYALNILGTVGATKPFRDSVDIRVVKEFEDGTGQIIDNVVYPDDFPTFQDIASPTDIDNDGMADIWEADNGFNVGVNDSAEDVDSNGYTNIEEYLHYLSGVEHEIVVSVICADVNQDSQINTTDAMLTFRNSLGLDMTGTAWVATDTTGDVNCDGNSNSVDAMLLLRYSLGLSMSGTEWCE